MMAERTNLEGHDQNHARAMEALRKATGSSFMVLVDDPDGNSTTVIVGLNLHHDPMGLLLTAIRAGVDNITELYGIGPSLGEPKDLLE